MADDNYNTVERIGKLQSVLGNLGDKLGAPIVALVFLAPEDLRPHQEGGELPFKVRCLIGHRYPLTQVGDLEEQQLGDRLVYRLEQWLKDVGATR